MAHAVTQSDPTAFMGLARARQKGRSMAHHALELVRLGRVPVSEAMRLAADLD
jgi:hypothetical protein